MKMIFILLLFISLTCSVCETFEVRSAQSFYQVFENEDITLEWTFTKCSLDSLMILCFVINDDNIRSVLLNYDKGLEFPRSGFFKERVQWDKDVLRERRIRLHVSSLRTEDSGLYSCEVVTREGFGEASCNVNVTDILQTTPETTTETAPEPEYTKKTETGVWIGLILELSALVLCICGLIILCFYKKRLSPCVDVKSEGNRADGETDQTEVSALKETVVNLNLHESSSSVRSHGHHVPTEHERQTLKLPVQDTSCLRYSQCSTDPLWALIGEQIREPPLLHS